MTDQKAEIPEEVLDSIEEIRRANHAIRACIRLLSEDSVNQGCCASGDKPFISLDVESRHGLLFAIEACSQKISDRFDTLEWEKGYPIGWNGSDMPDEWKMRSYPPSDDKNFGRRMDRAIAKGESDPYEAALKESWAEHDQECGKLNDDMPDDDATIQ